MVFYREQNRSKSTTLNLRMATWAVHTGHMSTFEKGVTFTLQSAAEASETQKKKKIDQGVKVHKLKSLMGKSNRGISAKRTSDPRLQLLRQAVFRRN